MLNSAGELNFKSNYTTPTVKTMVNSQEGSANNSMRPSGLPKTATVMMNQFMVSESSK